MSAAELEKLVDLLRERGRPENPTVPEMRTRMEELGEKFTAPNDVAREVVSAGGVAAEFIAAPGTDRDRVVLYLHGGGYVIGSPASHRNLAYNMSRAADARILLLDYRLAPEHPFPAAVDDAVAAYGWLGGKGFKPARMAVAGDSAGGGLAAAALVALRDAGNPLPAAGVCISPWTDMAGTGASMDAKAAEDPMVSRDALDWFADLYLGGADPKSPLASPIHASLSGLPPLLIQVGTAEILLDDAIRLADRAKSAGVDVTLDIAENMVHVWHLFAPMLSEARDAISRAGGFIRARTA